jgi:hypothetical protein
VDLRELRLVWNKTQLRDDSILLHELGITDSSTLVCLIVPSGTADTSPPKSPKPAAPAPAPSPAASCSAPRPRPTPLNLAQGRELTAEVAKGCVAAVQSLNSKAHAAVDESSTDEGMLSIVYDAGLIAGGEDALPEIADLGTAQQQSVVRLFVEPLEPCTTAWVCRNPAAFFAVGVKRPEGVAGPAHLSSVRGALTEVLAACVLGMRGSGLAWPERGWWGEADFTQRFMRTSDENDVGIVAVGLSAVDAIGLAQRLSGAGIDAVVYGPPSAVEGKSASVSSRFERAGLAVSPFPRFFPRIAMPGNNRRDALASSLPKSSWPSPSEIEAPELLPGEDESAPVSSSSSARHTVVPVDKTVASAIDTPVGGSSCWSVSARPPGDDPGKGSPTREAAEASWDVEECDGVDGGVSMRAVRNAIEHAVLQGDHRGGHPAQFDLTERGFEGSMPHHMEGLWLQYRRGRRSEGHGLVASNITRRDADVIAARLAESGLVAFLHCAEDADGLVTSSLPLTVAPSSVPSAVEHPGAPPSSRVQAIDLLFLRITLMYRQAKSDESSHGPGGDSRLSHPRSFLDFVRGLYEVHPKAFMLSQSTSEQALSTLPREVWTEATVAHPGDRPTECGIMFEPFAAGDVVITLPCGHAFLDHAVSRWLKDHITCPTCRSTLRKAPNKLLLAAGLAEPRLIPADADPITGLRPSAIPLTRTSSFGLSAGPAMAYAGGLNPRVPKQLRRANPALCAIADAIVTGDAKKWEFVQTLVLPMLESSLHSISSSVDAIWRNMAGGGRPMHLSDALEAGGVDLDADSEAFARRVFELVLNKGPYPGVAESLGFDSEGHWHPPDVPLAVTAITTIPDSPPLPADHDYGLHYGPAMTFVNSLEPEEASSRRQALHHLDEQLRGLAALILLQNEELWITVGEGLIAEFEKTRYTIRPAVADMYRGGRDPSRVLGLLDRSFGGFHGNKMCVLRLLELVEAGEVGLHNVVMDEMLPFGPRLRFYDALICSIALALAAIPRESKIELLGGSEIISLDPTHPRVAVLSKLVNHLELTPGVLGDCVEQLHRGQRCASQVTASSTGLGKAVARRLLECTRKLEGCEELAASVAALGGRVGYSGIESTMGTFGFYQRLLTGATDPSKRTLKLSNEKVRRALRYDEPEFARVVHSLGFVKDVHPTSGEEVLRMNNAGAARLAASALYLTPQGLQDDPLVATKPWF